MQLNEKVWAAPGTARGAVVIVHGYGEHIERYGHVGQALSSAGWAVRGYDLRGHGMSPGVRGHCLRFGEYLDDLALIVAKAKVSEAAPLYLLGHSFGALVSCMYLLERPPGGVSGLVLSSPYFKLAMDVPQVKLLAGKLLSKIYPGLALPSGVKGADVSRDPEVAAAYDRDPLNNRQATARWFTESTAAQEAVLRRAGEITVPTLVLHGGADRIACPRRTEEVFARLGSTDKALHILPGQYHEIFNELAEDRTRTLTLVTSFLSERSASAKAAGKVA